MQVQHLVGLHQPALASRCIPMHQIRRAETQDSRAAYRRNPRRHLHQPPGRPLVLDGRGLADLPGRLGAPVPELEALFVVVDLACRQVERLAAGKILRSVLRRRGLRCIGALRGGRERSLSRGDGIEEWLRHEYHLGVSRRRTLAHGRQAARPSGGACHCSVNPVNASCRVGFVGCRRRASCGAAPIRASAWVALASGPDARALAHPVRCVVDARVDVEPV